MSLQVLVTTPSGTNRRWALDEPKPEDVPSGISFSSTVPGGFESFDCQLPRKTAYGYSDLERLSNVAVLGPGGRIVWEGRLEKTPRQSGSGLGVNPQAVGYQAHLEDDKEATAVYVDRDLSHWGSPSRARKLSLYGAAGALVVNDPSVDPDITSGIPAINLTTTGSGTNVATYAEAWYDSGPGSDGIASIYYDMTSTSTVAADFGGVYTSLDDIAGTVSSSGDLITVINASATNTFTPSPSTYRFGLLTYSTMQGAEADHVVMWRRVTVWGNHGLSKQGTAPNDGVFASDVIAHAIGRWAPMLNYTTGANGTIQATSFPIPQLEFRSPTTVAEIISQANRFSLNDWNIWEGSGPGRPTFYYGPRNTAAPNPKMWRARVGPAQLQETGPQVERLWNGIIVTYQDVDGSTKSVGPTDSPCDTINDSLLDADPENPANKVGIKRYATLDMGMVSTSDAAAQVGIQFLQRAKELDQSGSAELVGHVTDDHGVVYAVSEVRAGDQISFVDASDTSYRRIVKASYDHDSRTCSIDLDAPPEGLDDLLERLSASLMTGTPPDIFGGFGNKPMIFRTG